MELSRTTGQPQATWLRACYPVPVGGGVVTAYADRCGLAKGGDRTLAAQLQALHPGAELVVSVWVDGYSYGRAYPIKDSSLPPSPSEVKAFANRIAADQRSINGAKAPPYRVVPAYQAVPAYWVPAGGCPGGRCPGGRCPTYR
jgi:hypothetical protein